MSGRTSKATLAERLQAVTSILQGQTSVKASCQTIKSIPLYHRKLAPSVQSSWRDWLSRKSYLKSIFNGAETSGII